MKRVVSILTYMGLPLSLLLSYSYTNYFSMKQASPNKDQFSIHRCILLVSVGGQLLIAKSFSVWGLIFPKLVAEKTLMFATFR